MTALRRLVPVLALTVCLTACTGGEASDEGTALLRDATERKHLRVFVLDGAGRPVMEAALDPAFRFDPRSSGCGRPLPHPTEGDPRRRQRDNSRAFPDVWVSLSRRAQRRVTTAKTTTRLITISAPSKGAGSVTVTVG